MDVSNIFAAHILRSPRDALRDKVVHVLHPWALSIVKHKTKVIMNLTYVDHNVKGDDDTYAFSIRV